MIIFKHRVNGDITKTQREDIAWALINGFGKAMEEQFMESPGPINCLVAHHQDGYCIFDVSMDPVYYNKHIGKLVSDQKFEEERNLVTKAYDLAADEYDEINT